MSGHFMTRLCIAVAITFFQSWLGSLAPVYAQVILAQPYVQPGPTASIDGGDSKVIAWVTDQTPGDFTVSYGWKEVVRAASPSRSSIDLPAYVPKNAPPPQPTDEDDKDDDAPTTLPKTGTGPQHYYTYTAVLTDLPADETVWYRVKLADRTIRDGSFLSRKSADQPVRFVAVGDLANGKASQDAVAFQMVRTKPDLALILGDITYKSGRASEYMSHYWRTYANGDGSSPTSGTALMASTPFYVMLGNHDADTSLNIYPDALAAYYFFHAPLNGPGPGRWNTPIGRDAGAVAAFRKSSGASYPALQFYSFDHGPVHFLVLDNCGYVKLDDPALLRWIENDLATSKARWKVVAAHAPAFHSSPQHYTEQKTRLLAPVFERHGVDLVLAGHVHNYQRSLPLRFKPDTPKPADRLVNGTFTIDRAFDGKTNTRPDGVIYVVSGGGGGSLYKEPLAKTVDLLQRKYGDNYAPFTATHVADRHSFVDCRVTKDEFVLRAVDIEGKEIESVRLTKP